MNENLRGICNAVKSDPLVDLSNSDFSQGFIVTVTSKATGAGITRWCKDEDDAEVFVETISTSSLLGDKGCFWYMTQVKELRAVCAENYYNV